MEQNNTMPFELDRIPTEDLPIDEFSRYIKISDDLNEYDDGSVIERVLRGAILEAGMHIGVNYWWSWSDTPADIRHAVFLIAANKYAKLADPSYGHEGLPFGALVLLECYRETKMHGGQNVE